MASVTIPDSVTSIGRAAFGNCRSLTDINYTGTEEDWDEISGISSASIASTVTINFNSSGSGSDPSNPGSGSSNPSENEVTANGGTGTSVVTLTAEATTFSVTVPTSIAINVSETGYVTCATSAAITNNSYGAVKVTGLSIAAVTGEGDANYSIVAYDTDMTKEKVDSKQIGLQINGETTTDAGGITFTQTWNPIAGGGSTQAITYDANVSASSTALETCNVATITFTVAWSK